MSCIYTIRNTFIEDLDSLLGGIFEEFSEFLGCENWERYDFKALLIKASKEFYFIHLGY